MTELSVEKRVHPFGEKGVNTSLEEVARRAAEGAVHPKVRAWAIECLERARKEQGLGANNDLDRAKILLRAVQKKLWVPDPVGTEWMAGAHLTACDASTKDDFCIASGDCDCKCVLLGACCLSVGLYVLIVGHSYDENKKIGHVLLAIRVDGKWMYADPTPEDLPLGQCLPFTRERVLSAPNIKVICDEDVCLSDPGKWDPESSGFVTKGEFVGVNGVGTHPLAWVPETTARPGGGTGAVQWLGATEEMSAEWGDIRVEDPMICTARPTLDNDFSCPHDSIKSRTERFTRCALKMQGSDENCPWVIRSSVTGKGRAATQEELLRTPCCEGMWVLKSVLFPGPKKPTSPLPSKKKKTSGGVVVAGAAAVAGLVWWLA